MHGENMKLTV